MIEIVSANRTVSVEKNVWLELGAGTVSNQWESDFMSVTELMARTGLTMIQITNDIKNGLFPGRIVRRQPQVARHQYERWIEGDLYLKGPLPSPDFVRQVKTGKLLQHDEEGA